MERVGPSSEEFAKPHVAANPAAATFVPTTKSPRAKPEEDDFEPPSSGLRRAGEPSAQKKWKTFPLHYDFRDIEKRANLITYSAIIPVAAVGFGVSTMFGFPLGLAICIAVAIGFGWVLYRSEQRTWYHYASWVFKHGPEMKCDLDLVSSGELDQPYVVLRDENRIARIYETRVFKLVSGDVTRLLSAVNAPGTKSAHSAIVHYDTEQRENAVVFEIDTCLLWCRAYHSRGI